MVARDIQFSSTLLQFCAIQETSDFHPKKKLKTQAKKVHKMMEYIQCYLRSSVRTTSGELGLWCAKTMQPLIFIDCCVPKNLYLQHRTTTSTPSSSTLTQNWLKLHNRLYNNMQLSTCKCRLLPLKRNGAHMHACMCKKICTCTKTHQFFYVAIFFFVLVIWHEDIQFTDNRQWDPLKKLRLKRWWNSADSE